MRCFVDSIRLCAITIVLCGVVYPLVVLGAATVLAPEQRVGSLLKVDGRVVGSRLIAQRFQRPEYFWPRPSAVSYDAAAAGGSNLSPASPLLRQRAEELIARWGGWGQAEVPAELLTASGSGLDPHLSLAGALYQVPRVAAARGTSQNELRRLIERRASSVGALGQPTLVNVLELNLELDRTFPGPVVQR